MVPTWQLDALNIFTSKLAEEDYKQRNEVCRTTLYLVRIEICFVHESIVEIYLTVGRCLRAGH